ncbi:MAG: hypothetical protein Kow0092_13570 [Deferrisomatales bacterium]
MTHNAAPLDVGTAERTSHFDEDSELACQAVNGAPEAFGRLVAKYQSSIYNYALYFFRDPTLAEDIAQETFLRAFRFLRTYDPRRRFATWLYAVARNLCIDTHRRGSRWGLVDIEAVPPSRLLGATSRTTPLEDLEDRENRQRLLRALHSLPEKYKTPIILCYLEGLPYQEISDILGISLNNTKIRIFRGKKKILEALGLAEE